MRLCLHSPGGATGLVCRPSFCVICGKKPSSLYYLLLTTFHIDPFCGGLANIFLVWRITIFDASRIPTSPSTNDAQASCLGQGSVGACSGTKRGAAVIMFGARWTLDCGFKPKSTLSDLFWNARICIRRELFWICFRCVFTSVSSQTYHFRYVFLHMLASRYVI